MAPPRRTLNRTSSTSGRAAPRRGISAGSRPGYEAGARSPTPLAALVGSPAVARVLLYLLQDLDAEPHFNELVHATKLGPASLQQALDRLKRMGIIVVERRPHATRVRVQAAHPALLSLATTVRHLAEPAEVLRSAYGHIAGLRAGFLYGSMAAGRAGPDSDVDVLLVADDLALVDADGVERATRGAARVFGREVNVGMVTSAQWVDYVAVRQPFLTRLVERPHTWFFGTSPTDAVVPADAAVSMPDPGNRPRRPPDQR